MNIAEIKELLKAFDKSNTTFLAYEDKNGKLELRKEFLTETQVVSELRSSTPVSGAAEGGEKKDGVTYVKSPIVGVVYSASEPDAPPLVKVGDMVKKGQKLCIVEAMKMFHDITAPCDGMIQAILFQNGDLVEYDKPLFEILV